eukprot:7381667-Pyramimonas_sp.AAC.1
MKRNRRLPVQHTHFLSQTYRMERSCQIGGRLLAGREMMRAICVWCSVRSESGQHWICRDPFKLTADRRKPNQDLYHFYSEWMEQYQKNCTVPGNRR